MIDPLIERARRGDAAAMEALLADVAPAVHRFGMRMCRNPADADDALQDALVSVATHLGEFEGRSSFTSWVFTLVRTACARRRRGMKNQPPVADDGLAERRDERASPEERASDAELAEALNRALDRLSEEHREVIQLRDIEGLTAPDTAAALGVSVDAVKSRLHRARAALREVLRPTLEPELAPAEGPCPDVLTWWSRRLEDEVSTRDCAAIEKHVAGCRRCSGACDALRRALGACQRTGASPLDAAVQARVRSAVRAAAVATTGG